LFVHSGPRQRRSSWKEARTARNRQPGVPLIVVFFLRRAKRGRLFPPKRASRDRTHAIGRFAAWETVPTRYFVKARLRPGKAGALRRAVDDGSLGAGSVAGGEYIRDMAHARRFDDGAVRWVEVCYCPTPLEEEIPYWEEYFELLAIKNAHNPARCRDKNGTEPWACSDCDCTDRLEGWLERQGESFEAVLASDAERPTVVGGATRSSREDCESSNRESD